MRRKAHVRFGERGGRDRRVEARYGAPAPTLRDPSPSVEDTLMHRRLKEAAEVVGVPLRDGLVIGEGGRWVSLEG